MSECPYVRIVVSRIHRKSSQRNILYPRVAPEILTTSLERFHNWANTKKEALSSRFLSRSPFSSGINLSSCYIRPVVHPLFPHTHILRRKDTRFRSRLILIGIFLFSETLNPRIIDTCVDPLHPYTELSTNENTVQWIG